MHVLLIEDHEDIAHSVGEFLAARGNTVDYAFDGITGLHLAVTNAYDAIVLDLNLPGMDGMTLIHRLRTDARHATPVLMLTARDTLADKVGGLESGADDYLVKPFDIEELAARLDAIHRRATGSRIASELQVGDLVFDEALLKATRAGHPLHLGPIPMRILQFLMRNHPRVVSRAELERHIWGEDPPPSDALRTHIATLRQAVDKPFAVPLIHTVPKMGVRIGEADAR